jgi:hypothetical protein
MEIGNGISTCIVFSSQIVECLIRVQPNHQLNLNDCGTLGFELIGKEKQESNMCMINDSNLKVWRQTKEILPKSSNSGGPRVGQGQPLAELFNDFINRTLLSFRESGI